MTGKRDPFGWGSPEKPADSPDTLRSIEAAPEHQAELEAEVDDPSPVYCEPQPLVAVSDHKTIEVETIKLAEEIDPRKLPTELRLPRPPAAPDSGVQPDLAVVSSQPPARPRWRWRAPLVLAAVLAALLLLVLARRASVRSPGSEAASASSAAEPSPAAPQAADQPTSVPQVVAPPSTVEVAPPVNAPDPVDPASSAALAPSEPEPRSAQRPRSSVRTVLKSKALPDADADSRAVGVSVPSQPKRAIY